MALDDAKTKQLVDYWVRGSTEDLLGAGEIISEASVRAKDSAASGEPVALHQTTATKGT